MAKADKNHYSPKKPELKPDGRDEMIKVQDDYESDAPAHVGPKEIKSLGQRLFNLQNIEGSPTPIPGMKTQ